LVHNRSIRQITQIKQNSSVDQSRVSDITDSVTVLGVKLKGHMIHISILNDILLFLGASSTTQIAFHVGMHADQSDVFPGSGIIFDDVKFTKGATFNSQHGLFVANISGKI